MKTLLILVSIALGIGLTIFGLTSGNLAMSGIGIALPFLVLAFCFPLLRRLAMRNAGRRPKETVLILLGSLLGTAIITSSGVVGDTFAASDRQTISTQLGPVDEYVQVSTANRNAVSDYFAKNPSSDVDGVLNILQTRASAGVGGNDPRALPEGRIIEMPFEAARNFGNDPQATGISGATPTPGKVVVTQDVADDLAVKVGDSIDLYVFGQKLSVGIERILEPNGLAGLNLEYSSGNSYNVYVAPNTLASLTGERNSGLEHITLISNTGDVFSGADRTQAISNLIETNVISKLTGENQFSDSFEYTTGENSGLQKVKQERIKEADTVGKIFRRLFIGIGSFTIIAGILLLINIFTMLAQERQSELGMLRAVGLRRRALVVAFSLEGFLYALGSALFGTIIGLGIGRIVAFVASGIFAGPEVGFDLKFAATFESMERGFVGGLGISMLTVVLASLFIARMNVIRAIRELPDNSLQRKRMIGLLIGLLLILCGTAVATLGIQNKNEFMTLAGPGVVALGAILFLRRWLPTKLVVTIASAAALFWSIFSFVIVKKAFAGANAGVYVLQGVQLTAFAVMLISANQEHIGSIIRLFGRGTWSMALRLGLAYPLARRGRTGLLLAMYSLVIFVLTFIMTISHALTTSVEKQVIAQSGGSDIELLRSSDSGFSTTPEGRVQPNERELPLAAIAQRPDIEKVSARYQASAEIVHERTRMQSYVNTAAFDQNFFGNGAPQLKVRDQKYSTDEAVFKAVAASTDLLILNKDLADSKEPSEVIKPGEKVTLKASSGRLFEFDERGRPITSSNAESSAQGKTFTIAAVSYTGSDALFSKAGLESFTPANAISLHSAYLKVKPGVDAGQVANQLSGLYVADNVEAVSVKQDVEDGFGAVKQFLMLIQGYMAIGLLVGIAGLGVVMVRAVRERRRQIGMLRAMGFPASAVRRSFLAEAAFIAGEGILIGAVLALVVLNRTFSALPKDFEIEFAIPWMQLLLLTGLTFVASILATAAPAQAASRISPAVALRTTD